MDVKGAFPIRLRVALGNKEGRKYAMDWLSQNWVWLLFIGAMIAMHLFGHGRETAPEKRRRAEASHDEHSG